MGGGPGRPRCGRWVLDPVELEENHAGRIAGSAFLARLDADSIVSALEVEKQERIA